MNKPHRISGETAPLDREALESFWLPFRFNAKDYYSADGHARTIIFTRVSGAYMAGKALPSFGSWIP